MFVIESKGNLTSREMMEAISITDDPGDKTSPPDEAVPSGNIQGLSQEPRPGKHS